MDGSTIYNYYVFTRLGRCLLVVKKYLVNAWLLHGKYLVITSDYHLITVTVITQ